MFIAAIPWFADAFQTLACGRPSPVVTSTGSTSTTRLSEALWNQLSVRWYAVAAVVAITKHALANPVQALSRPTPTMASLEIARTGSGPGARSIARSVQSTWTLASTAAAAETWLAKTNPVHALSRPTPTIASYDTASTASGPGARSIARTGQSTWTRASTAAAAETWLANASMVACAIGGASRGITTKQFASSAGVALAFLSAENDATQEQPKDECDCPPQTSWHGFTSVHARRIWECSRAGSMP